MNGSRTILIAAVSFLAGAAVTWVSHPARGETATATPEATQVSALTASDTSRREPQFENEHMKVWKSIIMPNQPLKLHRHDHGRAIIALTGGPLKVTDKDNKTLDTYDWQKGKAYWLGVDPPGQTHGDLNDTGKPIEVIVVELKNDVK